ncbi:hypothetical protein C9374_001249 [Naegleria lovaniensis]|uniref:F-box domain-containing protein n=1 Tax=Naegleria lovaniensis TaxID=51637 RepID=A0AA88KLA1_NAELO|nr:uncharacterized protein C9374_001249 [Naegleria lovaniensis]KAG2387655.1 hypothetical protein C9374_001249 [Naegleria lovaniensis]
MQRHERVPSHMNLYDWDSEPEANHCPILCRASLDDSKQNEPTPNSALMIRRRDLLIPNTMVPASPIRTVHLLAEKPKEIVNNFGDQLNTLPSDPKLLKEVENYDRCFCIDAILSTDECEQLIQATEQLGYQDIDQEYLKEYRNSQRVLVISKKLANLLWARIVPFMQLSDYEGVKPYGFDNKGKWKPIGINECLRFNKYSEGTFFKPHMDAQFIRNDNEKSIFTVLIYLDDTKYGTNLLKKVSMNGSNNVMSFRTLGCIAPKRGTAAIFNHDLYHEGNTVLNGSKYVLRTELIFRRVDSTNIYRDNFKTSKEFLKVKKLIDESDELEKQGKIKESTEKYLIGHELQVEFSHSIKSKPKKLSSLEKCLPEEIFALIFSFLRPYEICQTILHINSTINSYARNELLWKKLYENNWPTQDHAITTRPSNTYSNFYGHNSVTTETIELCVCTENQLISKLQSLSISDEKDWYHAFITRSNMESFFCPVILAPGTYYYRYGLANENSFFASRSLCLVPSYGHFSFIGYGYDDLIFGDKVKMRRLGKEKPLFRPDGSIESIENFTYLINQIYDEDLSVSYEDHPLMICVPPSWTEEEKNELKEHLLCSTSIPAIAMIDCSVCLSLYYQAPTCLIIDLGPAGVRCSLVVDNHAQRDKEVIFTPDIKQEMQNLRKPRYYDDFAKDFLKSAILPLQSECDNPSEFKKFVSSVPAHNLVYDFGNENQYIDGPVRVRLGEWYFSQIIPHIEEFMINVCTLENYKVRNLLLSNIIVVGGFSHINGIRNRLTCRLKTLVQSAVSEDLEISITFQQEKQKPVLEKCDKVKLARREADMDVVQGAKIMCNLSNAREYFENNPHIDE